MGIAMIVIWQREIKKNIEKERDFKAIEGREEKERERERERER